MRLLKDGAEWGLRSPTEAFNEALSSAVGHSASSDGDQTTAGTGKGVVELLRAWGATDWNGALTQAAFRGKADLMILFKEWGATNFAEALLSAIEGAGVICKTSCSTGGQQQRRYDYYSIGIELGHGRVWKI